MRWVAFRVWLFLFSVFLIATVARADEAIDWSRVAQKEMVLFYPGVSSWEFLTGEDHRLGGREIKKTGKECRRCHLSRTGELDLKADEIASGVLKMKRSQSAFEPAPDPGRPGVIRAWVKAAYDDEFMHIRVEWESKGVGFNKGGQRGTRSDRLSLQVNKAEPSFAKYGCFVSCHNDLNTMPESPDKKAVAANPYYARLGRDDVRLYAFYARDSWSSPKDGSEIEGMIKRGLLTDVLSVEIDGRDFRPQDGWVLDDRRWDEASHIEASGAWSGGRYVVTIKRRLDTGDSFDVRLKEGGKASFAIAIHDNNAEKRRHHVSFPFTIGFGADADIKAVKVIRGGR